MKPRILTLGTVSTEYLLHTGVLPAAGKTGNARDFTYLPGGNGTETAVAISRLGGEPLICAKVGDDAGAADIKEYLESENADTRFVTAQEGTNTALTIRIAENDDPERRIVCDGASAYLSESDIEYAFISYPDAVILHGSISLDALNKTVTLVRDEKNFTPLFVMSCGAPREFPLERIGSCEVLSVSDTEAFAYTGIEPADQEKCMKICLSLMQKVSAKHIIIRLGNRGYFLYDGTYCDFISAYNVIVPTGADSGNAFAAAFTLEYLRSEGDVKRSCEFASIVSAVYLTRGGGIMSYPRTEDIRRFIERNDIDFELR